MNNAVNMFILSHTAHTYANGIHIVHGSSTNVDRTANTKALIYVHFFVIYSNVGFIDFGIFSDSHLP